ncbi:MAG: exopolysaccharide biosynthesis protein [Firmicutes bacterium]|nr:exopolysaccharide biosynthesis protein [Bacillota bacterium]
MKTTIYIACHKEYWNPNNICYQRIHVGAANSNSKLATLCDDTGDSISIKNKNYCELTGLYWIWKNDKVSDIVGLCHYRRYFAFKEEKNFIAEVIAGIKNKGYIEKIVDPVEIERYFDCYDIILPVPEVFNESINEQYCDCHDADNWSVLRDIVKTLFPEYAVSMESVFKGRRMYPYNMFVMKKSTFDGYMKWLFAILERVEELITIGSDPYQSRVLGFMGERLLNLYVYHHRLRVKEMPIVFIDDNQGGIKYREKGWRRVIREFIGK